MATVHYQHLSPSPDTTEIERVLPALHQVMIAAGWTLEYADADAIGTGTAEDPAWDKEPATNTDAGIVVYRMPEQGAFTRWYARIRPGWAGGVLRSTIRGITIGDEHDGDGNVSGMGGEHVPSVGAVTTNNRNAYVNASEDGFFVGWILGGTTDVVCWVERLRLLDQSVQDALQLQIRFSGHIARLFSHERGVEATGSPLLLVPFSFSTTLVAASGPAYDNPYSDSWLFMGPYTSMGNPLGGLPRLFRMTPTAHTNLGEVFNAYVDGGLKQYQAVHVAFSTTVGHLTLATE